MRIKIPLRRQTSLGGIFLMEEKARPKRNGEVYDPGLPKLGDLHDPKMPALGEHLPQNRAQGHICPSPVSQSVPDQTPQ